MNEDVRFEFAGTLSELKEVSKRIDMEVKHILRSASIYEGKIRGKLFLLDKLCREEKNTDKILPTLNQLYYDVNDAVTWINALISDFKKVAKYRFKKAA